MIQSLPSGRCALQVQATDRRLRALHSGVLVPTFVDPMQVGFLSQDPLPALHLGVEHLARMRYGSA